MNLKNNLFGKILFTFALLLPGVSFAAGGSGERLIIDAIGSTHGIVALCVFFVAYLVVIFEEFLHLRKSKPMVFASGIVWILVAMIAQKKGVSEIADAALKHNILEYAMLFLFLLVAMTYVNAMQERRVFDKLRAWLVSRGYTYRKLFWVTGIFAFFISPIADNLTTALIMCAVVMAVGVDDKKFISLGCINVVVAANAGGAFSPFGDITTLMVWQKGVIPFQDFFKIFFPSVVSYVIPAAIMTFAIEDKKPKPITEDVVMEFGAKRIMGLFIVTITLAVCLHSFLHLPPVIGMMTGLSLLKLFGYYIKMKDRALVNDTTQTGGPFDVMQKIARAEWDTLLFFYGVILCVGGLATIGYLEGVSQMMYENWGAAYDPVHKQTPANIAVGIISAIVDNIPVMFAVLTMFPLMSEGQWLLVTLTAGVGGSLLSVGSAAGVALMGQARGYYTFFSHLKWAWAILLGYLAGIWCHIVINDHLFNLDVIKL